MRNLKKALSLTLALALSLSLAAPAFAVGSDWTLSVPGKTVSEFVMPSAAFKWMVFEDEVGTIEWEEVVRLNAGDSMVLTISKPGTILIEDAWSDPDGDGIYSQRMYGVSENGGDVTYTVLPLTAAGDTGEAENYCRVTTNGQLGWTAAQEDIYNQAGYIDLDECEWEEVTISADYLLQQFGPNTYLDILCYLRQGLAGYAAWKVYLSGDSQPTTPAEPEQPSTPTTPATKAVLSPQGLKVDGKDIECEKYNIDDRNYFKLRDLASLLSGTGSQFEVGYDEETATVSITTGQAYTPIGTELAEGVDNSATAQPSSQTIMIDGEKCDELTVYNIGGSNFFQLRELGKVLGFEVDYDADTNTAIVNSVEK